MSTMNVYTDVPFKYVYSQLGQSVVSPGMQSLMNPIGFPMVAFSGNYYNPLLTSGLIPFVNSGLRMQNIRYGSTTCKIVLIYVDHPSKPSKCRDCTN